MSAMESGAANEEKVEKPGDQRVASRAQLTAFATLVIAVVMLCAGLALMTIQHRLQTNDVDDDLTRYSAEIEDDFVGGVLPRVVPEPRSSREIVVQVVYAGSTVLASTENMADQRALAAPDSDVQHRTTTLAIADGAYRVRSARVGDAVIHTGVPIDHVEVADDALRTALAFVIPAVTLLLSALVWLLLGRRTAAT